MICERKKFRLQATLHVGDEIREINGISVANQVCKDDEDGDDDDYVKTTS